MMLELLNKCLYRYMFINCIKLFDYFYYRLMVVCLINWLVYVYCVCEFIVNVSIF